MNNYVIKRIFQSIFTLLIVSVIIFLAVHASGDPVKHLLGNKSTEEQRAMMTHKLGLDRPLYQQYGMFIGNAVRGDLGDSYSSGRPVLQVIGEKLPYTISLAVIAVIFAMVLTVLLGTLAAIKKDTWIDKVVIAFSSLGQSFPIFFTAIIFVQILGVKLRILPVSGAATPLHFVLPSILLGMTISSEMIMLLRNNMLEAFSSEYIKFARLKGLKEYKVVLKHALRNSLASVISLSSFIFADLLTGSIVVESIFAWPGVGTLSYTAVIARDFPLVQGIVLVLSTLMILLSLMVDLSNSVLDPRIRNT